MYNIKSNCHSKTIFTLSIKKKKLELDYFDKLALIKQLYEF